MIMMEILSQFRNVLSTAMLPSMNRRVILYGYGYTGRFLKWYAEYYHNIKVDYIISLDMSCGQSYEAEIFKPSFLGFDYKDSRNAIIWLAVPLDDKLRSELKKHNFVEGKNIVDFYRIVYGKDVFWDRIDEKRAAYKKKTGTKDIQFLEWLEWKYGCNFITAVDTDMLQHNYNGYKVSTQKEIFPILDKCHIGGDLTEGIFDFGCGKGGAIVSFCDYGFSKVGGVEYDSNLYDVLVDNMNKLHIGDTVELNCFKGDASTIREPLDKYSYFYFFEPFRGDVFVKCIDNIQESMQRRKRKVRIIFINPHVYTIMDEKPNFQLINQFTTTTRQKVAKVWESV